MQLENNKTDLVRTRSWFTRPQHATLFCCIYCTTYQQKNKKRMLGTMMVRNPNSIYSRRSSNPEAVNLALWVEVFFRCFLWQLFIQLTIRKKRTWQLRSMGAVKRSMICIFWDFGREKNPKTIEQPSKPLAGIPLNPGWFMTGSLQLLLIIPNIEIGSTTPYINQITKVLVTAHWDGTAIQLLLTPIST